MDTSAEQKHRPSRQARRKTAVAIRSLSREIRILSRFAFRMTRNLVIAKVRVSGGHLCGAEAPTEPAGETQNGCGNPFFFKGNTDSFALRVQNDRNLVIAVRVSGGHLCEAEAPTEPAGETAVRRAAIRSLSRGITDSFTLRVQNDRNLVIAKPCKRLWQSVLFRGEYGFFRASRSE